MPQMLLKQLNSNLELINEILDDKICQLAKKHKNSKSLN